MRRTKRWLMLGGALIEREEEFLQIRSGVAEGGDDVDRFMSIADGREFAIAGPATGGHDPRLGHHAIEEVLEALNRGLRHVCEPEAAQGPAAAGLEAAGNQGSNGNNPSGLPGLGPPA